MSQLREADVCACSVYFCLYVGRGCLCVRQVRRVSGERMEDQSVCA